MLAHVRRRHRLNHEKWNPMTKMQLNAVNYHYSIRSPFGWPSLHIQPFPMQLIKMAFQGSLVPTHLLLNPAYARNRHKANRTLSICHLPELWIMKNHIFSVHLVTMSQFATMCDAVLRCGHCFRPCLNYHFRRIGSVLCHWKNCVTEFRFCLDCRHFTVRQVPKKKVYDCSQESNCFFFSPFACTLSAHWHDTCRVKKCFPFFFLLFFPPKLSPS